MERGPIFHPLLSEGREGEKEIPAFLKGRNLPPLVKGRNFPHFSKGA
jgi:hypothetical protein